MRFKRYFHWKYSSKKILWLHARLNNSSIMLKLNPIEYGSVKGNWPIFVTKMEDRPRNNSPGMLDCSINIHSSSTDSVSPQNSRTMSALSNYFCNGTWDSSGPLHVLTLVTDAVLLVGAVIFIISLVIVFSIVVLAVIRVYSINCYYDSKKWKLSTYIYIWTYTKIASLIV